MDGNKIFGAFPDGFRMSYKDLMDAMLGGESICGDMDPKQSPAMKKLVAEHGGDPKMYWSEGGIEA
jgi:hypothetical protein